MIDPHVEPLGFADEHEGELIAELHAVVRDLNGNPLSDRRVGQCFGLKTDWSSALTSVSRKHQFHWE